MAWKQDQNGESEWPEKAYILEGLSHKPGGVSEKGKGSLYAGN